MKKLVPLFAVLLVTSCGEKSSSEGSESVSEEPSGTQESLSDADVEKLPEEAALSVSEIRTIAVGGDAEAQFLLGFMYAKGRGVLEDDKEAVKWFRKAAEQGHAEAQFNLGLTLGLGLEAVIWFRKAAEQGEVRAQNMLGSMYAHGHGVPEDHKEAVKWYRKSAEQGEIRAQFSLGFMYFNGRGVLEDRVTAYAWWSIAAANGQKNAKSAKTEVAKEMTPEQIAKAQELSREMVEKNPKLLE